MRIPHFLKIFPVTWTGHIPQHQKPLSAPDPALSFEHQHAFIAHPRLPNSFAASGDTRRPPQILFNDVLIPSPPSLVDPRWEDYTAAGFNPARLRTRKQRIARPKSNSAYQIARKARKNDIEWDEDEVVMPDVEHRETLLEMAKITGDAYALPGSKSWYDLDARWNSVRLPLPSIPCSWANSRDRAIHLVGKKTQTVSEGIYSFLQIIVLSSSPSKAHRSSCKARRRSATSSMTTCFLAVVVPMSTIHGDITPCATVARRHRSVTDPASKMRSKMRIYSTMWAL
jgi:hypothetical protein